MMKMSGQGKNKENMAIEMTTKKWRTTIKCVCAG
jgi:hypothetical protein